MKRNTSNSLAENIVPIEVGTLLDSVCICCMKTVVLSRFAFLRQRTLGPINLSQRASSRAGQPFVSRFWKVLIKSWTGT